MTIFSNFGKSEQIMTDRSFLETIEKTKSKSIEVHSDVDHSEWTWKVALTLALQSQVECFELCPGPYCFGQLTGVIKVERPGSTFLFTY